jgi:hypothetical protein
MKVRTLKEVTRICKKSNISMFCWGHRGIGKSSIIAQVAMEDEAGLIDMRCSQLEASDIRGLPDRQNGRTIYLPPADMPVADTDFKDFIQKYNELPEEKKEPYWNAMQPRLKKGYLFLDEVNRAQDDVLQSIFQLILDRKVGQYTLPAGWSVVCAGNFMEGYMVNGFTDPAFLNRFCHVTLSDGETTLDEWVEFMGNKFANGQASQVIEFATQNVKHLDGDVDGELGFSVQPSRRSWDSVVRVEEACAGGGFSEEARIETIAGLIGRELAMSYSRYSCPVKPRELVQTGVKAKEGQLGKLNRNQMTGLMWGLVGFIKPKIDEEKPGEVAMDFAEWMCKNNPDKDLVVAFCKALVSGGGAGVDDHVRAAAISNPKLAKLLGRAGGAPGGKKKFLDRLLERPQLQDLLSKTAWGKDKDD